MSGENQRTRNERRLCPQCRVAVVHIITEEQGRGGWQEVLVRRNCGHRPADDED